MISKRQRRYSQPQESLRQFSLNNSKGIDETKPITDPNTVLEMKNLTVNDDGSISLRKPMLAAYPATLNSHVMHTGEHYLNVGDGVFNIIPRKIRTDSNPLTELPLKFEGRDYYTNSIKTLPKIHTDYLDLSAASVFTTSDSTVVGNCYIRTNVLIEHGLIDRSLYGNDIPNYLPRYLQITGPVDGVFTVSIISPELNVLTTAEGEVKLNPNMCLDNPYAVRDSYGNTVPSILGILPYAHADPLFQIYKEDLKNTVRTTVAYDEANEDKFLVKKEDLTYGYVLKDFELDSYNTVTCRVFRQVKELSYLRFSYNTVEGSKGLRAYPTVDIKFKQRLSDGTVKDLNITNSSGTYVLSNPTNTNCQIIANPDSLQYILEVDAKVYPNPIEGYYTIYTRDSEDTKWEHRLRLEVGNNIAIGNTYYTYQGDYRRFDASGTQDIAREVVAKKEGNTLKVYDKNNTAEVRLEIKFEGIPVSATAGNTSTNRTDDFIGYPGKGITPSSAKLPPFFFVDDKADLIVSEFSLEAEVRGMPELSEDSKAITAAQLTENVNRSSFRLCEFLEEGTDFKGTVLKAFCRMPKNKDTYYATWEYSKDGQEWNPYGPFQFKEFTNAVPVKVLNELYEPPKNVEALPDTDANGNKRYVTRYFVPLNTDGTSNEPWISRSPMVSRIDIFPMEYLLNHLRAQDISDTNFLLRFRISTLVERNTEKYVLADVSMYEYSIPVSESTTYAYTDYPNAVLGEKLYYKKSVYSYGTSDYGTFAYVTDPGSFITPLYNVLDLDVNANDTVCQIVPWRNYLVSFTERSVYMSSKTDTGFYTKTVSTSIGVPFEDRRCVKAALNGILFKSRDSVYFAYPSLYASDDSVLNLTEVSRPIKHLLNGVDPKGESFAEVMNDTYLLMVPTGSYSSECLSYNLTTKTWERYTYPVYPKKFVKDPALGMLLLGTTYFRYKTKTYEYLIFDDDYSNVSVYKGLPIYRNNSNDSYYLTNVYGDVLEVSPALLNTTEKLLHVEMSEIPFIWDTGQKTDSISDYRQFVESKFAFATLDEADAFPFTLHVAIDGDPHVTTIDVSTDAPFWKTTDSKGVANTTFRLGNDSPATGVFNTLRQLVVRYSGKGKSIRHIIEGESNHNFKLYETYVRYKNISGK